MKNNNINIKRGDNIIFDNASIAISAHKKYLIIGKNGIGKSSLIEYLVNENIKKYRISYATQSLVMLENLSINENIKIFNLVNIEIHLNNLLYGIDRNKKIRYLSGGQKQKLRLLFCLCSDAEIYILDEPFNNLDKFSQKYITESFLINNEKTIILILHKIEIFHEYETIKINDLKIIQQKSNYTEIKSLVTNKKRFPEILFFKNKFRNNILKELICVTLLLIVFLIANTIPTINTDYNVFKSDDFYYCETNCSDNDNSIKVIPLQTYTIDYALSEEPLFELQVNDINFSNYATEEMYIKTEAIIEGSNGLIDVYPAQLLHPNELMSEINYLETIYPINKLIYGTFPADNSNEVIIDEMLAVYIMNLESLDDINKVIGYSFEYLNVEYVVSGIYKNTGTNSYIFKGYNSSINSSYKTAIYSQEKLDNALSNPEDQLYQFLIFNYKTVIFGSIIFIFLVVIFILYKGLYYALNKDTINILTVYHFKKPIQRHTIFIYIIIFILSCIFI